MNRKERLELANWAVEQAKNCGVDEVAVNVSNSRRIEVEYRDKKLEKLKESTQSSLGLEIYADNRYSGHSTNDLHKTSLKKFIQEAAAMTKYLTEDKYRSLPDPKYYKGQEKMDLKILDAGYDQIDSKKRVSFAKEIEAAAMAQSDKIISTTAGYSDTYGESVKVHSNGFVGERQSTYYSAGAEVTVRDEDGGRPEDWFYASVRFYKDLPEPNILGEKAAQRALRKIGQEKIESGVYDMVVENRAGGRLLYALRGPMTARALQQKSSFLEGMLDKKIASEILTVTDDPFVPAGMGSQLYDGEGIMAKRRVMIDKGVLKSYYVDNYYGKKLGIEPTSGSSSNIVFDYGTESMDDMVKDMKKGILVTDFIGGNSNGTTGDFSFGIVGLLVEDGKIIKPVNEMNISGNMKEFWNQLVKVGNDPYTYSSVHMPSLYFKDVQFSGI